MAKYRQLHTEFWSDGFVMDLTPEEKYFYLYLMTNSKTSQCGIYELPKRIIEAETGYNRETVEKLIKRFCEYNKIDYCDETKEIMLVNWMKYNIPNNTNAIKCVNKELSKVKNKKFLLDIYNQCKTYELETEKLFEGLQRCMVGACTGNENNCEDEEENSCDIEAGEENQALDDNKENFQRGYEGAYKRLGSKEVRSNKEEVRNKKEEIRSNKQEVISENKKEKNEKEENLDNESLDDTAIKNNKNTSTEDATDFKAVIKVFENNIHPLTPMEYEKLLDWSKDVSNGVIIMAIEEAVNYSARNMKYIAKILNSWIDKGITTPEGVKAYQRDWEGKKKEPSSPREKKSNFCDYEQRQYDMKDLERKLLGLDKGK